MTSLQGARSILLTCTMIHHISVSFFSNRRDPTFFICMKMIAKFRNFRDVIVFHRNQNKYSESIAVNIFIIRKARNENLDST